MLLYRAIKVLWHGVICNKRKEGCIWSLIYTSVADSAKRSWDALFFRQPNSPVRKRAVDIFKIPLGTALVTIAD